VKRNQKRASGIIQFPSEEKGTKMFLRPVGTPREEAKEKRENWGLSGVLKGSRMVEEENSTKNFSLGRAAQIYKQQQNMSMTG